MLKGKLLLIFGHCRILFIETYWTFLVIIKQLTQSARDGQLRSNLKLLYRTSRESIQAYRTALLEKKHMMSRLDAQEYQALRERVHGLHSLLPGANDFTYSILIPVYQPDPVFFRKALQAAINQTAPNLEIMIGYDGKQPQGVYDVVSELQKKDARAQAMIKIVHCDRAKTGGGISRTTNEIAEKASGKYLLFMDHDDWIRPDLLYRYELTLRLATCPENLVLYCNEYKIDEQDNTIASSFSWKPEQPPFPYVFLNYICHCLLVPRALFLRAGTLRPECDGSQDYDLCLRLDLHGALFQNVPIFLYAWRVHAGSTAKSTSAKDYATPAGVRALNDYIAAKKLDWETVTQGFFPTSYQTRPRIQRERKVHVIIPYKDHRDLTIKAVQSIRAQKLQKVSVQITCIDNRSSDKNIATTLAQLGAEILHLDEPFNFSRINNIAVQQSKHQDSDLILFMNNDVELHPDALVEMVRWIEPADIGMVGCRLHYPDQKLQHGGVDLSQHGPTRLMTFSHREAFLQLKDTSQARVLGVTDAVTAACALVKKDAFTSVGGFDEIWYPIAYSDTDLTRRLRRQGYHSLYTPYASGVHHESQSRGFNRFEEMEGSRWLFTQIENRNLGQGNFVVNSTFDFPGCEKNGLISTANLKMDQPVL